MVVQDNTTEDGETSTLKSGKKHRLKQRFDVRQILGQGTYGKVQLAINRETGQEVAIKTIKKSKIETEQDLIRIRREIQIMSSIQHPHIIHIYEVFENKDKIVLVMQFASGGELYDYLNEKKVLSDLEARRIFRQIAAAVYYCHKNKICHRDLKLENILLDEKGNAKIADFGLSNVFDDRHLLKTYCGSPLYASPEIVKGVPYYGPEVDCWSMGVLLYTLVYGAMPFDGSNFKKLVTQISEGDYFEPKKKSKASGLIHQLLAVNPLKRATIVDICTDFWVNQGYEHSLLQVAEDMAELTPVRLDLLLALAPSSPVPDLKEQSKEETEAEVVGKPVTPKGSEEEEEEEEDAEEEEDCDGKASLASTFEFVRRSQVSNFSASSPDLQQLANSRTDEDEFLPSDVAAALEEHTAKRRAERSFEGSLAHVSSISHKSKKTKKSESMTVKIPEVPVNPTPDTSERRTEEVSSPISDTETPRNLTPLNDLSKTKSDQLSSEVKMNSPKNVDANEDKAGKVCNSGLRKNSSELQSPNINESKSDLQNKKMGRAPGKIVIPKTFEFPLSTPSPKALKSSPTSPKEKCLPDVSSNKTNEEAKSEKPDSLKKIEVEEQVSLKSDTSSSETIGKTNSTELVAEEKKAFAKGILKKGIAKAKLAERKLSQQSSTESELPTPSTANVQTSDNAPSFFKAPKPYSKDQEQQQVKSKAEIVLSSPAKIAEADKAAEIISNSNAPLWDSVPNNPSMKQMQNRNLSWGTISSTLDSEIGGWREQMEESLRRLSPDGSADKSVSAVNTSIKSDDDKALVPIARSYKKFTFTKDGACITETKKIYTTPGADGSWTKVEKKTKITTRPGNAEEFERFRDLHMRTESPLTKSDSQSSSGSNEVYDDIFDSWTGDTMMCNMMKIKNMFQKFSQDPFMRSERRRNPFRNFRRTESDRNDRCYRRPEIRGGHFTDREYSDYDEPDCDISFDGANPIVYGSQGLWQFLKPPNKQQLPRRVMMSQAERSGFTRSVSQDRSGSKLSNWKQCESRASSGYNTNSRSQSPHEKVLRFVFESPSQDKESSSQPRRESKGFSRTNNRRDSGINSDGYESEHYHRAPSEDFSKSGRVSPISTAYSSGRQGIIRDFVKSWPKEVLTRHSISNETTDNRRNKVEQWLHMNDMSNEDFPFKFSSDSPARMASRKTSIHDNLSSAYATMRPREYMKYTRSSSDKISDSNIEFVPFDDGPSFRSMLVSPNLDQESLKGRVRSLTYSPVSEESSREARSIHHSDSSQSNTSVHQINFTFSDGRVSTSQSASPHSASRNIHVSGGMGENTDGNVISVEQITPKGPGQPIVQMRVSFNRGNRDNKVIHTGASSPPTSIGLWQHQDQLSSPKPSGAREVSPVPGIKKFSTEIVHNVGSTSEYQGPNGKGRDKHLSGPASIQISSNSQKGKSHSPFSASICPNTQYDACSEPCMDNAKRNTNLNLYCQYSQPSSNYTIDSGTFTKDMCSSKPESTDVNTPDSLEDSIVGLHDHNISHFTHSDRQTNSLCLDVKPVGVLWNTSEVNSLDIVNQKTPSPFHTNSLNNYSPNNTCDLRNSISDKDISFEKPPKYRVSPLTEIGSIWEQRNNNCQTFDLIKGLLADDRLDNMVTGQCLNRPSNERISSNIRKKNPELLKMGVTPLSMLEPISVIDYPLDKSAQPDELNNLMPSFMDDLQSPQKVLHQALKILKTCE